jgi:hypothetical protein
MQHIITRLGKKNKKEEKNLCHENVEKVPLCKRYTNVHYVVLCGKINVIFQRIRTTATTTKIIAQCSPTLLLFIRRQKRKLPKLSSF